MLLKTVGFTWAATAENPKGTYLMFSILLAKIWGEVVRERNNIDLYLYKVREVVANDTIEYLKSIICIKSKTPI